jgi:hypothetical protein
MVKRKDELIFRASRKPCPWCATVSGFRALTAQEGWTQLPADVLHYVAGFVGRPRSFVFGMANQGLRRICAGCNQQIGICPGCDTPNRLTVEPYTCSNCGSLFGTLFL